MIEKLKSYANYVFGAVIIILGGVLFNRNRKLQQTESELATAVTKTEITLNDQARKAATDTANALVDDYERSKR